MRRHLAGIGLAVVMVLAMFFLGGWGYVRLLRLPAASNAPVSALPEHGGSLLAAPGVLAAIGTLAVTGLLAGILIAYPRISPFAPGLAGLFLIAWEVLYLVSVRQAVEIIPLKAHAFGSGWEGLLFNGMLGAAGLMLIIPLFVPSRWRGRSEDDEYEDDDEDYVGGLTASMRSTDMPTDRIPVGTMAAGPGGPGGPQGPGASQGSGAPGGPRPGMMRRPPRALPPGGSGSPGPGGPGPGGPGPGGPGGGPGRGPGSGPGRPGGPDFGDSPTVLNPVPGGPRGPRTGPIGGRPPEGDPRMRPRPFRRPPSDF